MAEATRRTTLRGSIRVSTVVGFTAMSLSLTACNNAGQGAFSGAAIGTLGGLAIGSLSGNAGEGAIIGLVSGAIAGGVIGDQNARRGYASGTYDGAHGHDRMPAPTMPNYYDPRYDDPSAQRDRVSGAPQRQYEPRSDFEPDYGEAAPPPLDDDVDPYLEEELTDAESEENVIPFYSGPTLYDYDGVLDLQSRMYSYVDTYDDDHYYDDGAHYSVATYASYSPSWSIRVGLSGYYGWCSTCDSWHHNRYTYRCGYRPVYYSYYDNYWRDHWSCYDSHRSGYYTSYRAYYPYRYSSWSWCGWRPRYSISIGYSDCDWWWGASYGYSYYGFYGYYDYWGYNGKHGNYYDCDDDRYRSTKYYRDYKDYPVALKKKYRDDPNKLRRERREDRDWQRDGSGDRVYASRNGGVQTDDTVAIDNDSTARERRDMLTRREMERRRADQDNRDRGRNGSADDDRREPRRASRNENGPDRNADRDAEMAERIARARGERRDMVRDRGDAQGRADDRRAETNSRRSNGDDNRIARSDPPRRDESAGQASERRTQVQDRSDRGRSNARPAREAPPERSADRAPSREAPSKADRPSQRRSQPTSRGGSSKGGNGGGNKATGRSPGKSSGGGATNRRGGGGSKRGGNE